MHSCKRSQQTPLCSRETLLLCQGRNRLAADRWLLCILMRAGGFALQALVEGRNAGKHHQALPKVDLYSCLYAAL